MFLTGLYFCFNEQATAEQWWGKDLKCWHNFNRQGNVKKFRCAFFLGLLGSSSRLICVRCLKTKSIQCKIHSQITTKKSLD